MKVQREVRPTIDVDAIVEITSYADNTILSERLRTLGFTEDSSEGAPTCRWLSGDIKLDVMPLIETFIGFSNRWYESAHRSAQDYELETNLHIRVVTPPYFCATESKLSKDEATTTIDRAILRTS